ncbi:hypothetical protein GCM10009841_03940 [Microlunatus panaciterrae]|uniref:Uncharacterized protein n=1 Tax=Microlunatus panaciterrae TaxID=400768 RepID=A0ABS2RLA6_9ACTN|nr:hypothetical protein [Microlunatus panaciterrae]MBM7798946.1 hypothetical protein [Microlunatus panaciterrae]
MAFISSTCEPLRIWSRLEPRAREVDFAGTLAAKIADPVFMLGRQWQFGEFAGADAGSAIFATLARQVDPVLVPGAGPDDGLDAITERLPIDFPLIVRARLGRTLLSRLDAAVIASGVDPDAYDPQVYRDLFYRFFGPLDAEPTDAIAAARDRTAPRAVRARRALRGRCVDGVRVYQVTPPDLTVAMFPAEFAAGVPAGQHQLVRDALLAYRGWFESTYPQPDPGSGPAGSRWEGDQLEYAVSGVVARGATSTVVDAAEHQGGHLDWYSFDQGATGPTTADESAAGVVDVRSVIPVPAEYPGMPQPRWWQFEDAAVDLGQLSADATDAARIVVSEFALLYSNDWFTILCRQPVGSVAELQGVVVTDTFGWRTLVQPTVDPAGSDWTGWDAFSLAPRPSGPPQTALPQHLYLPKTLPQISDGEPLEQVAFVRDETADMVWAIEQRIPDFLGGSRDAAEASRRLRQQLDPTADAAAGTAVGSGQLRYILQTEVAENWIPFIPVHLPGQLRAIQLQRGTMRRTIGPEDTLIRPMTSILRLGIDDEDTRVTPYYVHEEEVSRAGVQVQGLLRRARRYDGTPVVWHARRVTTGRGEARSGLAFDRITSGP